MKIYNTFCFKGKPKWDKVPIGAIDCYQWESEAPYRPKNAFQMCFVGGKGIYVRMKTDEKVLRVSCRGRDEPVYEDSCMEFFFMPVAAREEYINIEVNPIGAYLSQFGSGKENRVFVKSLTNVQPTVHSEITRDGWQTEIFIPCGLFFELNGEEFTACAGEYCGNFYKCGDKTDTAHYGSFAPMTDLPPGFHNPKLFAKIIVNEE
ncbi:MAG: carbohydrate-binding family 9-like protein [Ruminococcus sp.]|nr:carbohydrate-binding family 9-like protein [Ruminococcus sp.]